MFGLRGVHEDGWRPNSAYTIGQGHGRLVEALSDKTTLDAGVELYATTWDSPGFLTDSAFQARQFDIVENPTGRGFQRPGGRIRTKRNHHKEKLHDLHSTN